MKLDRGWVTPLTAGAFLLSAVTGILIFFHLDRGLNKLAHEWLSWALLAGVLLHLAVNFGGFKRHFTSRPGLALMGIFALILALSFIAPGQQKREPPFMASVQALSETPLSTLAQVAKRSPAQIRASLNAQGLPAASDEQTIADLVGPDMRQRSRVLEKLLVAPAGSTKD